MFKFDYMGGFPDWLISTLLSFPSRDPELGIEVFWTICAMSVSEPVFTSKFAQILVEYSSKSVQVEEDFHFLRFEFLQRVNIVALENELAQIRSRLYAESHTTNPQELEHLRNKLQQYGKPGRKALQVTTWARSMVSTTNKVSRFAWQHSS